MISIVMPVYNPGGYFKPCVESILAQTYRDWELILVDDGSSDGSEKICDDYAKHDNRIRAFHKTNEGATSARRFGVAQARGEWIFFSDSDDIIPPQGLQKLLMLDNNTADIIVGTVLYKNSGDFYYTTKANGCVAPKQYIRFLLDHTTQIGPVAKLIKRTLFDGLEWLDYHIFNHEDMYLLICLSLKCGKYVEISNENGYYLCNDRPGTISNRIMDYNGWIMLFQKLKDILFQSDICDVEIKISYYDYVLRTLRRMLIERGINYHDDTFIKQVIDLRKSLKLPITRQYLITTNYVCRSIYMFLNKLRK